MRTFTMFALCLLTSATVHAHGFWQPTVQHENGQFKEEVGDAQHTSRDGSINFIFLVKDANEVPMRFFSLRLYEIVNGNPVLIAADETERTINVDQMVWRVDLGAGAVGVTREFRWELRFSDPLTHTNTYVNRVKVANPLPGFTNWYRLDLHVHTNGTDTVFENGHIMEVMAKAATSIGLHGFGITDHGESVTDARWSVIMSESAMYSSATRRLIPGVEANAAPVSGSGVLHLTVHGLTRPLKTPSLYPASNNGGRWSLTKVVGDSATAQNARVFAAHPYKSIAISGYGPIQTWTDADFDAALAFPAFKGMEVYNERKEKLDNTSVTEGNVNPFPGWQTDPNWPRQWDDGMRMYQRQVQRLLTAAGGNAATVRTFWFCAGSDAHGDLNYKRWNRYGFWDLAANDDALGKIHTVILAASNSQANLLQGMDLGQMLVSDGPLLRPRVRLPNSSFLEVGSRLLNPNGSRLVLDGASNAEFGPFTNVFVMRITSTAVDTLQLNVSGSSFSVDFPLEAFCSPSTGAFLVVEAHTSLGYRSVANPHIVGPATATDVGVTPQTSMALMPNPVRGPLTVSLQVPQASVTVYTVDGHRLVSIPEARGQLTLPTHQWPAGTYLVQFDNGRRQQTRKLTLLR